MPNSFRGNWIWWLHHDGFLVNFMRLSFILLITFWPFCIPLMVVMYQIVKTMHHMCVCLYICPWRLTQECPLNSRHFMRWKIAHPWWGSKPRYLDYIPSSINSCHVSDHQRNASHIYLYIYQGSRPRNCKWIWQKYELRMSDDGHFEFHDWWENSVTYSLAYDRSGFSTKKSYRTNKWSTFPQKCLQVFIKVYISIFCPDYYCNLTLSHRQVVYIFLMFKLRLLLSLLLLVPLPLQLLLPPLLLILPILILLLLSLTLFNDTLIVNVGQKLQLWAAHTSRPSVRFYLYWWYLAHTKNAALNNATHIH